MIKLVENDDLPIAPDDVDLLETLDEEASLEHETAMLRLVLGAACSGHHTRAVMAGLTLTLQTVVVEVSQDMPAIEQFAALFLSGLRQRWLFEQDIDKEH